MDAVETITRDELKKMDRGNDFVLIETVFRRQHLPGVVNLVNLEDMGKILTLLPDKSAETITYCTNFN